ncbi:hypothetical protein AB3M89_04315 [Microbacterium sp. 179-I 3D2 NHS]|uniref:hypothetical protein n=1 Tax=Microbacterium sp. 179-I 3D2 NHS TaxID=3235178 RepID=UPI0039A0E32E
MRVNKWGVGVVLAASVLLAGCSAGSDEPAEKKPSEAATEETQAPASDCPELKEGDTIEGAVLAECVTDALTGTAGFAAKMSTMGIESTTRSTPSEGALETISPVGSVIVIGDERWVKSSSSEWQAPDTASSDPVVAGLSSAASAIDPSDPMGLAGAMAGEYTVTGTGTRLGQEVFLLSGTSDQQGTTVEMVFEVTADYAPLAATGSTELNGQSLDTTTEITEWDVAQEIVAP